MTSDEPKRLSVTAVRHPVLVALLISLLIHGGGYGVFYAAKKFGWKPPTMPKWLRVLSEEKLPALVRSMEIKPLAPKALEPMPTLTLIEIDPSLAVPEPPKDAKFYSAVNAKAANPDLQIEADKPKIDGKQDKVPKLADAPKPQPKPLQPQAPQKTVEPKPQPEVVRTSPEKKAVPKPEAPKPAETKTPGDLALARPSPVPTTGEKNLTPEKPESAPPKRSPPRTIAEALQRQPQLAGQKMKQEGGVRNLRLEASQDARATPFGAYDLAIVQIVQQEWYNILADKFCPGGKVVIEFRMLQNGRVENVRIAENEVGELFGLYCQLAVTKPRFDPWPGDMRRLFGEHRDVRFTFYYN
ncbi:MAG: hypothetical protein HZA89_06030 [Verrucomicrobia bacterium]|nr:hypothetical protein [Verrucomicrobiota bacterium]